MADTKVFSFPEQGGYNNNGGFLNGNGWGGGILGFLLGLMFGASATPQARSSGGTRWFTR